MLEEYIWFPTENSSYIGNLHLFKEISHHFLHLFKRFFALKVFSFIPKNSEKQNE